MNIKWLVYAIYRVVEIVTVDRSLGLADSGKSAVKGVAVPVDYEAEAAEPKEVDVHAAEDVPRRRS